MFTKVCFAIVVLAGAAIAAQISPTPVTFNKDVLPILQKNCQSCHRPGEIAPMSLLSYKDARPWHPLPEPRHRPSSRSYQCRFASKSGHS